MKNLFLQPVLVVSLGLIAASTNCLHAATFTVTTTNISGPGSLPVAIAQANATPGKNQIKISVTNAITLGLQLPVITNSVAITGIASVPSIISGGGTLPLFTFAAGTTNSLSNLVLANGYTMNSGAAISNASTLSVISCVITNHSATNGSGGAIINSGFMAVSSSVISGNKAGSGGALLNSGTITFNNSVLSLNQATNGGAIFNTGSLIISEDIISNNFVAGHSLAGWLGDGLGGGIYNTGTVSIVKTTLVANSNVGQINNFGQGAFAYGGALFSMTGTVGITNSTFFKNLAEAGNGWLVGSGGGSYGGAVYVVNGQCIFVNCSIISNSTIAQNSGGQIIAGGVYNYSGNVTHLNTIIAGNSASSNSPDLYGAFVSSGVNLIGNNQGATGLSLFDFQNVAANLGTLQNNGGSTLTCAPLPGSYAIGNGISTGAPTTDQRGVPRPQNGAYDIGAVQVVTGSPYVPGGAMVTGSGYTLNTIFDATNSYRVQASTNLTSWVSILTNGSGGGIQFTDSAATNLNRRFYRTATP